MDKKTRSPLVAGLILILLGVFFLIIRLVPDLLDTLSWPFIVIGVVGSIDAAGAAGPADEAQQRGAQLRRPMARLVQETFHARQPADLVFVIRVAGDGAQRDTRQFGRGPYALGQRHAALGGSPAALRPDQAPDFVRLR
jgi:hypothetical protein